MRIWGGAALALGILAGTAGGAVAPVQATPVAGLAGYWKLDATSGTSAVDSSGNGHTGTLMNGAAIDPVFAPVPPGNQRSVAIVNAAAERHIRVPGHAAFNFTAGLTLACWIRLDASPTPDTQMGLIERWSNGAMAVNGYMLRLGRIGSPATGHHLKVNIGNGSTQIEAAEYTAIPKDTWTHVAATWDGSTLRLYKNGALVDSETAGAGSVAGNTEDLEIGQSGPHRLQGKIDEVYVFDTALTTPQIGVLANGQPAPTNLQVQPQVDQLLVSWTAAANALRYDVYGSPDGVTFSFLGSTASTSYTDTTATYPGTYHYKVTAQSYMESAALGPVSGSPLSPVPRTNDHDEGMLDGKCACGSTAEAPLPPAALLLAALAVLLRRRRS